jgi:DNA-binding NarL/FixJ family response regulator
MLADDHQLFLSVTTVYLRQYTDLLVIGQTTQGRETLALAQNLKPQVVLIDLIMPDLPGLEVIPRLRAEMPEVGIIALTLHDSDGYRKASLAAGADDFITKSRITTDLLPAIKRVALARGAGAEQPA